MDVRESDVAPELSEQLKQRLDAWIERHFGALLVQLEKMAKGRLESYR